MHPARWVAIVVLAPSLAWGQSLGDAAAKERERRRKLKETGTTSAVVDGDALKASKGTLANDPRAVPAPKASPSPGPVSATPLRQSRTSVIPPVGGVEAPQAVEENEAFWRAQAKEAREEVEHWQARVDYWSNLSLAPGQYFVDDDGTKLVGSPETLQKIVGRAKAHLAEAKQAFEDLETEARRKSVPPGWLR